MGRGFAARASTVIRMSDIILEIVDARFAEATRNRQLERKAVAQEKTLIVVANKVDLAEEQKIRAEKQRIMQEFPCILMSAKERKGKKRLLQEIGKASHGESVVVGVIGYPNTGKSSIVNLLKGKKSARTSRKAGFTRGEQEIKISETLSVIDTPGVIPVKERDEFKLFLVGAKNTQDLKDREFAAEKLAELLLKEKPGLLEKVYGIKAKECGEVLEELAFKRNRLLKGGNPDTEAAARILLEDWTKGRLAGKS